MGVNWTVLSEIDDETEMWLEEFGVTVPDSTTRCPTGEEILDAIKSLPKYEISINDNGLGSLWQVTVSSTEDEELWTMINVIEYKGLELENEFYFEKGNIDLIKIIVSLLSKKCGRFILLPDTGDQPIIVDEKSPSI